jgi:hydrogenase maturation protein HypF
VRAVALELAAEVPAPIVSARFHETLIAATAAAVRRALRAAGARPVVLTGGCFQNRRLAEGVLARLGGADVHLHHEVPPGDGGIGLGQALVADAIARGGSPCV